MTLPRALGASLNPSHTWGGAEAQNQSSGQIPEPSLLISDLCKSCAAHPASKRPKPKGNDGIDSPNPHPSPKLSKFHCLLPKGGLSHPVGGVNEQTQPNSSHGGTLEGQGATVTSCSRGNSVWRGGETLFTRVVKHWSRGLARLWHLQPCRAAKSGWTRV